MNIIWKGINDDKQSIDALVKFCKYVPCKVNLIEYNPIDDGLFQQASEQATQNYIAALEKKYCYKSSQEQRKRH